MWIKLYSVSVLLHSHVLLSGCTGISFISLFRTKVVSTNLFISFTLVENLNTRLGSLYSRYVSLVPIITRTDTIQYNTDTDSHYSWPLWSASPPASGRSPPPPLRGNLCPSVYLLFYSRWPTLAYSNSLQEGFRVIRSANDFCFGSGECRTSRCLMRTWKRWASGGRCRRAASWAEDRTRKLLARPSRCPCAGAARASPLRTWSGTCLRCPSPKNKIVS